LLVVDFQEGILVGGGLPLNPRICGSLIIGLDEWAFHGISFAPDWGYLGSVGCALRTNPM
jgi:hypothetical protein